MQVWHGLAAIAAVVDHQAVAGLRDAFTASDLCGSDEQVAKQPLIRRLRQADAGQGIAWHYEDVHRCLRENIAEGEAEFILVDDIRRDFSIPDFFEKRLVRHAPKTWQILGRVQGFETRGSKCRQKNFQEAS